MRVALTGAQGFTGRYVAQALLAVGAEPVALGCDLTDAAAVAEAVAATPFDRLIHLAGRAFVGTAEWKGFYAVNQIGTFHLLKAVAEVRPGARCILASSAQVYGPGAEGLIAENALTRPANHYAVSKRAMEMGADLWRESLEIVVTRPFNYTGIGQDAGYLIPKIVDHYRRRARIIELGNTWVMRDFGDVRSVADAYVSLVLADTTPPPVVNIATGVVHSIDEILDALAHISGHTIEVRVNSALMRSNDVPILGGDITCIRAALDRWQPRLLNETLSWMYSDIH